jgi:hypothetical protein
MMKNIFPVDGRCHLCGDKAPNGESHCADCVKYKPRRSGYWQVDDSCGYLYAIFDVPRNMTPAERAEKAEEYIHGLGWITRYGGPGRSFSDDAYAKHYAHAILIVQRRGLDI